MRKILVLMGWALVATQSLDQPGFDADGNPSIVSYETGQIVNMIAYDGNSDYKAPSGTVLTEVDDDAKIGDTVNQ